MTEYLADENVPVVQLAVGKHFVSLTPRQQRYAHHLARASWHGARVVAAQLSHESPAICRMLVDAVTGPNGACRDLTKLRDCSGVSAGEFQWFLEYAVCTLSNLGPYKSFGDTKFVPRLPIASFEKVVAASGSGAARDAFARLKSVIYSLDPEPIRRIGFPADGHVSGFYSSDVSRSDVEAVQTLLDASGISALNTRLFRAGPNAFDLRIASAETRPDQTLTGNSISVRVQYGDFAKEMADIVSEMQQAVEFAGNDNERLMCECYVKSFRSGSIDDHKQSQVHWIRDVGPPVETNIGFIETYRDPAGVRAEWEGFVAVVNADMTAKFAVLVENAQRFLAMMPWPRAFEKDVFHRPDFTSLEVLSFATGGLPAGINIPNYDDIRQTVGFKNVSLGNVLNASSPSEKVFFLSEADKALFQTHRGAAFEIQVGLHELLGHGSGKLLTEDPIGTFNFDRAMVNPIDGRPVRTWYKPGETWGSVFKGLSSSYEECRAETVAMHLMSNRDVLGIFGHGGRDGDDVSYVGFLSMAKAGLSALEFYDPASAKWGQAHMQARWAIFRVFLEAGLAELKHLEKEADLLLTVHRDRIATHGAPAVASFLSKLQVYKATADAVGGTQFYTSATAVDPCWLPIRDVVLSKKQPRKVFVQCNTFLHADGSVTLKEYEPTLQGVLQSVVERRCL
ncbi:unnamed protein product (mitochondrion) [Plasmodiophora brassicae]|uniref:Dipeptidyl peptidase 3 n=1 Tax=Plasmodiophora brassicae TaxID=37360 RepID=A0A0G4J2L0_PLABS|nr:hypothetical protein PBRA_008679 [Plasmodiophora brassicae]SPR01458.1 unnamed protein product [Plasmodiophora brassicae]